MRSMNHSSSSAGHILSLLYFSIAFPINIVLSVLVLVVNAADYKLAADDKTM